MENNNFNNEEFNNENNLQENVDLSSATGEEDVFDLSSFSSKSEQAQKDTKKGNKKRTKKETVLKVLLTTFLIGAITCCLVVGGFLIYIFGFIDYSMVGDLDELSLNFTTTIYCKDSKTGEFVEYQRIHGGDNRIWISDDEGEIPQNLKDAIVAIEDKDFRDHDGVDWGRTIGAFANEIFHFSSKYGGSTITQQLVKNITDDRTQNASRKIREIMRAHYLESNNSKDVILESYINTVAMANGMYGAEVASNYYFNKSAKDLTLAECACLAAVINLPEYYRPDLNPINNKERRDIVLSEMYSQGYITKEEMEQAKAEELVIVAKKDNLNEEEVYSYFVDTLIDQVVDDLVEEYGYDRAYAENKFFNAGYKIYTTLDLNAQTILEETMKSDKFKVTKKDKEGNEQRLQGSMTIMDYSGHIVAICGGFGEKTENRGLNRATMSFRQPGSSIKPLSAYAPALEKNMITYSSFVKDYRKNFGDWAPNNWYGGNWGDIPARYALEQSSNTIPVYLIESMGLQNSYNFLKEKLGITNLVEQDMNYASLGMGGTYTGLTTMQSAAAFAIFGNGGKYYEPTTYYEVLDQKGEVVLTTSNKKPVAAISEDTATIMNKMLQNVVYNDGTGAVMAQYIPHMKIFAKTGTADQANDVWLSGGTPYYVASAWCGFDTLMEVPNASMAKMLWGNVMSKLHSNLPSKSYPTSEFVTARYYCTETGGVATTGCTNLSFGYYKTSYMPACTKHSGAILNEVDFTKPLNTGTTTSSTTSSTSSTPSTSSETSSTSSTTSSTSSTSSDETSSTASTSTSATDSGAATSEQHNTSSDTVTSSQEAA